MTQLARLSGSRPVERFRQVARESGLHLERLVSEWVREGKPGGVQELAPEPKVAFDAVERIAGDREVDRRQVHPDLVRPPRFEPHAEQGVGA